jgi:hypothetical protein
MIAIRVIHRQWYCPEAHAEVPKNPNSWPRDTRVALSHRCYCPPTAGVTVGPLTAATAGPAPSDSMMIRVPSLAVRVTVAALPIHLEFPRQILPTGHAAIRLTTATAVGISSLTGAATGTVTARPGDLSLNAGGSPLKPRVARRRARLEAVFEVLQAAGPASSAPANDFPSSSTTMMTQPSKLNTGKPLASEPVTTVTSTHDDCTVSSEEFSTWLYRFYHPPSNT